MTDATTSTNCVIPEAALRWIILHATTSNVDLARLSNVNRSWRDVVTTVILEQATGKAAGSCPLLLLPSMAAQLVRKNNNTEAAMEGSSSTSGAAAAAAATSGEDTTKPTKSTESSNRSQDETFCAAWFAPEGIQLLDLDAEQQQSDQDDSSEDYNNNNGKSRQGMHRNCRHSSSAASNAQKKKKNTHNPSRSKSPLMMNIQRRAPRLEQIPQPQAWGRGHGPTVKPSFEDQGILVSHEWRGYRHAMQVLFPFGYADFFVQHVLQRAQVHDQMRRMEQQQQQHNSNQQALMDVSDRVEDVNRRTSSNLEDEQEPVQDATLTTIAVRGATIARPEGYCLCWEHASTNKNNNPDIEWSRSESSNNNNDEMVQTIKWQERQRKLKQWKEWRRQLQLTVLPQVLVRTPPHSNAVVQFLNSDEKHAVRFLTPKFQCGPIGEPVTIFVVGIATEDGCFCSGLHHRFELGHLYPNNPLAELAEMSPICMATDAWEYCAPKPASSSNPNQRRTPLEQHLDSDDDSEADSDDDYSNDQEDDDSSSDLVGDDSHRVPPHKKRGWLNNCACIFHDNSNPCGFGTADNNAANDNDDDKNNRDHSDTNASATLTAREDSQTLREDDEDLNDDGAEEAEGDDHADDADRIMRGSRIPGMWHCYTAVYNGKQSVLRVDGVPEVVTTSKNASKKATNANNNNNNNAKAEPSPTSSKRRGPRAMLDGLTIGSDHCFDMTLCFGQGSGGEGEGAIAEIAVFGGCLDTTDLEVIERQLMIKHGIPTPELTREALVREDEWTRKAHALYCQIPPEAAAAHLRHGNAPLSFDQSTIPLRVMAKHRSVAWHQFNAVTGEELRIKRIGSRSAGSSSEW